MDNIDQKIERIYKEKKLQTLVTDYTETESSEVKAELYEKIKLLIIELGI